MPAGFKDHFSAHSNSYAEYRPVYPAALFEYLASLIEHPSLAWDAATGNGQAAVGLAQYFERVHASDASDNQIAAATPHPGVTYAVARSEHSGLPDGAVDLITVGQAFHWFDETAFLGEAKRVLKPGGVLAIWCYQLSRVTPACDAVVDELYDDIVADYWPAERDLVEQAYAATALPGEAIIAPEFKLSARWQVEDMLGYLSTWSACKRYEREKGSDPVGQIEASLRAAWGSEPREVIWPLPVKLSRVG